MILEWKKFVLRGDIKSLPLEEQRREFLKEQLYYDNLLSEQRQQQYQRSINNSQGGAGGGGKPFVGQASDGPLSGATVSSNVGTTTTDTLGNFTFKKTPVGEITVTGGVDSITGTAFTGELKGFPEYKTISPITTLAYHLKEESSLTMGEAIDLLFDNSETFFGVNLSKEDKNVMLQRDYIGDSVLENNTKSRAAQSIATYLESVTEVVGSSINGADPSNFPINKAKIESYKSIARQISSQGSTKTTIDPVGLYDRVKVGESSWTNSGSLEIESKRNIAGALSDIKSELSSLSKSELYSSNYITTQIQSINKGAKENHSILAKSMGANTHRDSFATTSALISTVIGKLPQIEVGKANETNKNTSKQTLISLGTCSVTQILDDKTSSITPDLKLFYVNTLEKGTYLQTSDGYYNILKLLKSKDKDLKVYVTYSVDKTNSIQILINRINGSIESLTKIKVQETPKLPTGT